MHKHLVQSPTILIQCQQFVNMGLGKVILAIFGIFLILLIVVGVDAYMTYNTFSGMNQSDVQNMVSNPQFSVGDQNKTVTISVSVDLPKAGFIPKGVDILLTVTFDGNTQTSHQNVNLGETKTLSVTFTISDTEVQTLASGGSITVTAKADVTPTVIGYAIKQATQKIDLGSQTIQA